MTRAPTAEQAVLWASDSEEDDESSWVLQSKVETWPTYATGQAGAVPPHTAPYSKPSEATKSAEGSGVRTALLGPDTSFMPRNPQYDDGSVEQNEDHPDDSVLPAATAFQNDSTTWCRDAALQLAIGLLAFNLDGDLHATAVYGRTFNELTTRLYETEGGTLNEAQKSRYLMPFRTNYGLMGKTKTKRGRSDFTAIERDMIDSNYHILETASRGPEFAIPERFEVEQLEATIKYHCGGATGLTRENARDIAKLKQLCDKWENSKRGTQATLEQLRWELMEEAGQRLRDSAWSRMGEIETVWRRPGNPPQNPFDPTTYPRTKYGTKHGTPYAQMDIVPFSRT